MGCLRPQKGIIRVKFDTYIALNFDKLGSFRAIHELLEKQDKLLVFLTKAEHKIKKKAEQIACDQAIKLIEK